MERKSLFIVLAIIIAATALIYILVKTPGKPGQYDELAMCLGEKEALFYGAFWCPSCREQKAMFGKSAAKLPYVECSTPDGKRQKKECGELGIETYPTWIFRDGEKREGVVLLEDLASKTGCSLPQIPN